MPETMEQLIARYNRMEEKESMERAINRVFRSQVRQAVADAKANQIARRLGIARSGK